jgi:16S rRNA G966 N2-methylase RsmD
MDSLVVEGIEAIGASAARGGAGADDGSAESAPPSSETKDEEAVAVQFEGSPVAFRPFPEWRLKLDSVPKSLRRFLIDYSKVATVPPDSGEVSVSDFSSTMPFQSAQCQRILRVLLHDPKTKAAGPLKRILDLTAHIGVDTANTALAFPGSQLTAVEIDPLTAALHRRNMEALGLSDRVETLVGDSTALASAGKLPPADLALVDPPWGGPDYWKEKTIPQMSERPFAALVADLLEKGLALAVSSKLPMHVDVEDYRRVVTAKVPEAAFYERDVYKMRRPKSSGPEGKLRRNPSFQMFIVTATPDALPKEKIKAHQGQKSRARGRGTRGRGTRGRGTRGRGTRGRGSRGTGRTAATENPAGE